MGIYPQNWTQNYTIAYGILGSVSDVDADKVYDYHTTFDIKPTEVSFNVDINNSAATVKMVKDIIPFTKNNLYRECFEDFYDFSDASNYKLAKGASKVTFTGVNTGITFLQNDLTNIDTDGLRTKNGVLNLTIPNSPNFTLCLVMSLVKQKFNFFY